MLQYITGIDGPNGEQVCATITNCYFDLNYQNLYLPWYFKKMNCCDINALDRTIYLGSGGYIELEINGKPFRMDQHTDQVLLRLFLEQLLTKECYAGMDFVELATRMGLISP